MYSAENEAKQEINLAGYNIRQFHANIEALQALLFQFNEGKVDVAQLFDAILVSEDESQKVSEMYGWSLIAAQILNSEFKPLSFNVELTHYGLIGLMDMVGKIVKNLGESEQLRFLRFLQVWSKNVQKAIPDFWLKEVCRALPILDEAGNITGFEQAPFPREKSKSILATELGSFTSMQSFSAEKKALINSSSENQQKFISNLVYQQFFAMRVERNESDNLIYDKTEPGRVSVPLPQRDNYSLVVHVGNKVKKIIIPATQLNEDPVNFDQYLLEKIKLDILEGYQNFDPIKHRKLIDEAYHKPERIQDVDYLDPDDITTADLVLVLSDKGDLSGVEDFHNDPRMMNFGSRRPVSMALRIKDQEIQDLLAKCYHPNIDGLTFTREIQANLVKVFEYLEQQKALIGREKASIKYPESFADDSEREKKEHFLQATISIEWCRDVLGTKIKPKMFEHYLSHYGVKVPIQAILQFATMMTLDSQHGHFLEKDAKSSLAPALAVLSKKTQELIETFKSDIAETQAVSKSELEQLLLMFGFLQADRSFIRKNNTGVVRTMAAMANGLRQPLTMVGGRLNPTVTEELNNSILVSMVVGKKSFTMGQDVAQTAFTTANADAYHTVVAISDSPVGRTKTEEAVFISVRQPKKILRYKKIAFGKRAAGKRLPELYKNDEQFKQAFEANLKAIMDILQAGMQLQAEG